MQLHDWHLDHRSKAYLYDLYRDAERERLLNRREGRRSLRYRLLLTLKAVSERLEAGLAEPYPS